jgi:hypothetical protein
LGWIQGRHLGYWKTPGTQRLFVASGCLTTTDDIGLGTLPGAVREADLPELLDDAREGCRARLEAALFLRSEPGRARPRDGLGPVRHLESGQDIGDVVARRLQTDAHAPSDLLVAQPLREQP